MADARRSIEVAEDPRSGARGCAQKSDLAGAPKCDRRERPGHDLCGPDEISSCAATLKTGAAPGALESSRLGYLCCGRLWAQKLRRGRFRRAARHGADSGAI